MAEDHRLGVAAVLAADAHVEVLAGAAALLDAQRHQRAHAGLVDGHEWVLGQQALGHVAGQEPAGVVPGQAQAGLGQVVGAEGEELRLPGDLVGHQAGPRQLDHGADGVAHLDPAPFHGVPGHALHDLPLGAKLLQAAHQGDHHLRARVHALLAQLARRPEDRLGLHLGDFRERDGQPAAAMPEHGVGFPERLHLLPHRPGADGEDLGQRGDVGLGLG